MILYLFILCYSIYDSSFKKHILQMRIQMRDEYYWLVSMCHMSPPPFLLFIVALSRDIWRFFFLHQVPWQLKLLREDK